MMFEEPIDGGSRFSVKKENRLIDGALPDHVQYTTIEKSIAYRRKDPCFETCKDIDRDLYVKPEGLPEYTKEQLNEIWIEMGLQVYPYNEESTVNIPAPFRTFKEAFEHNPRIMAEIERSKFEKPSSVQSQMWPTLLQGKDCVGVSQTGSGKTLAFLLPAFLHIDAQSKLYTVDENRPCPFVLVITPTRELAQQIRDEVEKYSYNGYRSVCLYGGGPRREQMAACEAGVEIVIATPGRLADLAVEGVINLRTVSYVVLDEADRMLQMGFEQSIRRIMFEIRPDRLVALTSATWPEGVRQLAQKYTKDAIMIVVGTLDLTACLSVKQYIEFIENDNKFERTCEVVRFLTEAHGSTFKLIIFVRSKGLADHLSSEFCLKDINSQALHGGRSQEDRENSLKSFRIGNVQILVATDVASRGIDVPDITHVMNYDFPSDIEEYVHRIGRTGRAGRNGESLTFFTYNDRMHAQSLIDILTKSEHEVPNRLISLAAKSAANPPRPFVYRKKKDDHF